MKCPYFFKKLLFFKKFSYSLEKVTDDPFLTFPLITSDDDNFTFPDTSHSCSSGIADYMDDDRFSGLLSASQVGTIASEMDLQDPTYIPPVKLSTNASNFSDYFSEEEYKSSDSIIFTCQIHQLQYDNIDEFEEHQVNEHTVNGRFACGLCDKTYSNKYLRRGHVAGYHLGETYSCSILTCGKKFSQKKYRDQYERMHNV